MFDTAQGPMQGPKQPRGERRRALIVEAATEAFLRDGYDGASLCDVVGRAGGSRRDVYAWFGNKEGLFAAVVEHLTAETLGALDLPELCDAPPRQALTRFGTRFVETLIEPRVMALFRVIIGEGGRFPEIGRALRRATPVQTHDRLVRALRRWSDEGLLRVPDPDLAATCLLDLMKADLFMRVLLDPAARPSRDEVARHVAATVDLILTGLEGPSRGLDAVPSPGTSPLPSPAPRPVPA